VSEYIYYDDHETHAGSYLLAPLTALLQRARATGAKRLLDVGCGNGAFAKQAAALNFEVVGVDESRSGIDFARRTPSPVEFRVASVYDELSSTLGHFDVVTSLEVIEHLYDPRRFVKSMFDLLNPGGLLILSTPYHGYLKNLALAVTGRMDRHFTALWDHGHIKFWSEVTISSLLDEAGFREQAIKKVGRIPPLAKTMIVTAVRPLS